MGNKNYWLSGGLLVAIGVWLASGYWNDAATKTALSPPTAPTEALPMAVQVQREQARPVTREIVIQGQIEPDRSATVRAETEGTVAEILAERGRLVQAGDAIVRIATADREARLAQTEALVRQRENEYRALQKLGKTGFQAETRIDQALADLEAARADLKSMQIDMERTVIRAPFDGILNERQVEIGEMVQKGDAVATIVDLDPLIVSAQLPQQHIGRLQLGDSGTVRLITGEERQGTVRYISSVAEPATRTFEIELAIANPDYSPAVGLSSELRIPVETVAAHFLSPAQLSLNTEGMLGVKTVTRDASVAFYPVTIVRAESRGVWVSGLPETVQLITVGQGFVEAGEKVRPMSNDGALAARKFDLPVN